MNPTVVETESPIVPPGTIWWESGRGVSTDANVLRKARNKALAHEDQSRSVENYRRFEIWQRLIHAYEEARQAGWNAGEGEPVSRETLDEAERFLLALPESFRPTDIYPESDGDLTFEWYASRDRLVIVSFDGKHRAIYTVRLPGEREAGQVEFAGWLPPIIRIHLKRFFALGSQA